MWLAGLVSCRLQQEIGSTGKQSCRLVTCNILLTALLAHCTALEVSFGTVSAVMVLSCTSPLLLSLLRPSHNHTSTIFALEVHLNRQLYAPSPAATGLVSAVTLLRPPRSLPCMQNVAMLCMLSPDAALLHRFLERCDPDDPRQPDMQQAWLAHPLLDALAAQPQAMATLLYRMHQAAPPAASAPAGSAQQQRQEAWGGGLSPGRVLLTMLFKMGESLLVGVGGNDDDIATCTAQRRCMHLGATLLTAMLRMCTELQDA